MNPDNIFFQMLAKCPRNGTTDLPCFLLAIYLVTAPCMRCLKGGAVMHHLEHMRFLRFSPSISGVSPSITLSRTEPADMRTSHPPSERPWFSSSHFFEKLPFSVTWKERKKEKTKKDLQFTRDKSWMLVALPFKHVLEVANLEMLIFPHVLKYHYSSISM